MGFLDKLKVKAIEAKTKAAEAVDGHGPQIKDGIQKAGSYVDQKTKGKYSDKIAKGTKSAEQAVDKMDKDPGKPPADPKAAGPKSTPPAAGHEGHAHPHQPVHPSDDQDPHTYSPPPVV